MQTATTAPLSALSIDDKINVRRTGVGAEPAFVSSIRAKGVIEPLVVRKNGKGYKIANGGKRYAALRQLLDAGDTAAGIPVTADYPVPVLIREEDDAGARETSLMTNFVRSDMHPVDEYRAFVELHADKEKPMDAAAIAARFGMDVVYVEQRLALGRLHDTILDAWLAGAIDEETAEAFTLCPSPKAQAAIYEQLRKRGHRVGFWDVRRALKIDRENPGKFLTFVGIEAYQARGGKVTRDLFGDNHVVSDGALVKAMVAEKLDATCKGLVADGWAWAMQPPDDRYNYGHLEGKAKVPVDLLAAKKANDKKERELSDAEEADDDAEEAARVEGLRLNARIAAVSFTAEQKAKSGCFVSIADGEIEIEYGRVKPAQKRAAAASERKTASSAAAGPKPSESKVISNALKWRLEDQLKEATKKALKTDTLPDGLPAVLQKLVAGMIGGHGTPGAVFDALPSIRDAITPAVMNAAIRKEFDRADFFGNAPIPVLTAAIAEAVNSDEARKLKGKKKSELAKFAAANVGKTDWLPKELRTAHYDGPGGKKAQQQPAKKKRAA